MIEVEAIRKTYNGTRGLDQFSLHVKSGELIGLVGPNGAGKTTLIKILATLLPPDAGVARIAGVDVTEDAGAVKRLVGYMPDHPGLYQDMRVSEFLEFFVDAFKVPRQRRHDAIEQALSRSGLRDRTQSFVEELSLGMKQRLVLAKTLLHDPKILLLDEPATGLDPLARIELRNQLKRLHAEGATILISSHILSDLEDICARIALIADGRNVTDANGRSVIEIRKPDSHLNLYALDVLEGTETAAKRAAEMDGVRVLKSGDLHLVLEVAGGNARASEVLRHLVSAGIHVVQFARVETTLEDRYREVFSAPERTAP